MVHLYLHWTCVLGSKILCIAKEVLLIFREINNSQEGWMWHLCCQQVSFIVSLIEHITLHYFTESFIEINLKCFRVLGLEIHYLCKIVILSKTYIVLKVWNTYLSCVFNRFIREKFQITIKFVKKHFECRFKNS